VATVHTKKPKSELPAGSALPEQIDNIPVDVREASPHQRLRAHDPAAAAVSQAYGRPEDKEPDWPLEREMPSGELITSAASDTQKTLKRQRATQPATDRALTAQASKPQIPYAPPAGLPPLKAVTVTTTITAAASPDAGFKTLTDYLQGTQHTLIIGMYDFTSGPLLAAFLADLKAPKSLEMVLDNPAPNPTRDQTDVQTVQELNLALGSRAQITRALTRGDAFAAKWIFPSAYHIKVIVRDNASFWLSSGNLNNSNEPDPTRPPKTEDRDWHVIIQDAGLAQTFAAYIGYDYKTAATNQAQSPGPVEAAVADAHAKRAAEANPPPPRTVTAAAPARAGRPASTAVAAKTFSNINLTITPLLTPDKIGSAGQYLTNITQLIAGAQKSIYIQLQYIEASSGQGDPYDLLLKALAARAQAGVKLQMIESADYAEKWLEKMKSAGVDLTAYIRLQPSVHNKGFVVDSKTVVVSSQNFSPEGVTQNRDAGVILASADIAKYFEPIFLADWSKALPAQQGKAGGGAAPKTPPARKPKTAPKRASKSKTKAKRRG
jgi:phosphatidylserine/phosphatidylglycerophosphate/cardiolipin synthase-like enzyme